MQNIIEIRPKSEIMRKATYNKDTNCVIITFFNGRTRKYFNVVWWLFEELSDTDNADDNYYKNFANRPHELI